MSADFLVIGGLGDLALRKLYPAFYHLHCSGHLSKSLRIVVMARQQITLADFLNELHDSLEKHSSETLQQSEWETFAKRFSYCAGDAVDASHLSEIHRQEFTDPARRVIIYFAIPSSIVLPVCHALQQTGRIDSNVSFVLEKPLGNDLDSFREIDRAFSSICSPEQIYRIDHYLGKESVQNLLALRFANTFIEPLWNNHYIDHVQISVMETVGVEGRWSFYNQTGALRDMVQNHLLQILCLIAMDPPHKFEGSSVHQSKLEVLLSLRHFDKETLKNNIVRGQYIEGLMQHKPVVGYLEEEGATPNSDTETFVAMKAHIDNWRWHGVPFYLRTGKRMQKRYSEIVIQFREVPHQVFTAAAAPNRLIIRLQPDEGIRLSLMNKVPGIEADTHLKEASLDLLFGKAFDQQRIRDAYERLLLDVLRGNNTLFVHSDELELAWKWVDGLVAIWQSGEHPPIPYISGSLGPNESTTLLAHDGRAWY